MKKIRMLDWLLYAIVLTALIAWLAPHQLLVTAYKLSLIALAAVCGYWIDRSTFPYARPDDLLMDSEIKFSYAMQRRAIIMSACILGVSLGA